MYTAVNLSSQQSAALLRAEQETLEAVIGDTYKVVKPFGRGGETLIYKVQQRSSGQFFVAKLLNPLGIWYREDEQTVYPMAGRLRDVAATLQRVGDHPNIPFLQEFREKEVTFSEGSSESVEVLIREYKEGRSLDYFMRKQIQLSEEELETYITDPIINALVYIHDKGEAHRDLKPVNLLFHHEARKTALIDFGLTRRIEVEEREQGRLVGTPRYFSPDRIKTGNCTLEADLFSLGITLIETAQMTRFPGRVVRMGDLSRAINSFSHLSKKYRSRLHLLVDESPEKRREAV